MNISEYKEVFLLEAREYLSNLNNSLVALEKDPAQSGPINEIFRAAHTFNDLVHVIFCNTGAAFFQALAKQFCNTSFNIINDLIATLLVGKEPAQTFHILFEHVVSRFLNGNHPALEVYINYLFHGLFNFMVG